MRNLKPSQLLPPALFILLPLVLFWQWLVFGHVLYWGTVMLQFWPWRELVKDSLLQAQWPLWNPLLGNGTPLLANLQSAVFYPFNLLLLPLPTAHALTLSIMLHLSLAGWGMYGYARQLKLTGFAATIAAVAYMFSGYIVGRTQFIVMVQAAAWLPVLLLLGDRLATRRRLIDALWLAVALAVQLLAGHAQLWFYSLCLTSSYVVFRSWQWSARGVKLPTHAPVLNVRLENGFVPPESSISSAATSQVSRITVVLQAVGYLALAVFLALLLSAVQILPTAEFLSVSPRSDGAERTFALTYSMWPWRLITLVAPDFFGHPAQGNYWGYATYWEDHAYQGILPFILALTALGYYVKTKWQPDQALNSETPGGSTDTILSVIPFYAAVGLVSLILAMGWNTPVYLWVFEVVPGFSFFQAPARLLIWYTVAVAVMAGVGAQLFEATAQNRPHWRRFLAACVALTLVGLIGQSWLAGRELTFLTATRNLGFLLIIAVGLLLLKPPTVNPISSREKLWQGAVVLFVAVDLLLAAWPLIPLTSASIYSTPIASTEALKGQPYRFFVDESFSYRARFDHYFQFKSFGPNNPAHLQQFKELLVPNLGVYAHLPSANNNDPLVVGRWQILVNLIEKSQPQERARLLVLMNVQALISDNPTPNWSTITESDGGIIQAVPESLPRAYFVSHAVYVADDGEAMAEISAPGFDPRREVVIIKLEDVTVPVNGSASAPTIPARVVAESAGHVRVEIDAPTEGFVVLTDTIYPGWRAAVDNQPVPIWPANLTFRAVTVGAGFHTIHMSYHPLTFTFGLWTSIVACFIMGVAMIRLARQSTDHTSHLNPKSMNNRKNP
ncbi:MAG: YfhO family protein [Anaerolineae bacterium]|nr:YfhO family protein [Anaerolineae bacterium]